ncbi:NADPH-dependent F420 reductase [Pollutibacter soli]|uniref:NADPH-dependent F420 reductase n=1 Tax=Pollutibacter soli TaxID=3034157 RepID=UPI0030136AD2
MTKKLNVAIIGLGNIGTTIAGNLVKGNRQVIMADRKLEKAESFAKTLGSLAKSADISTAIEAADIIVFAVWFNVIDELMKKYEAELEGKIIIDPSNPIAPDNNSGFKKIIGSDESAGKINSTKLPLGAKLVKAFGTLGVESLKKKAFQQEPSVLFYASDDESINGDINQLIRDSGFEPLRIGGIDESIRIEVFGDLHEYGALGKTVTLSEAKEKLHSFAG